MQETGENYTTALRRLREERAERADQDSVIVKLSDGEIQVPEDCPIPDEMLRAMNATPSFLAPEYRKAADDA